MRNDIAIYAMGGGFGHIMRASGLARSLLRLRPELSVCLYIPQRGKAWVRKLNLRAVTLPCQRKVPDPGAWLKQQFLSAPPRLLIVDCFPLGIRGELGEVLENIDKTVFVTRWLAQETMAHESVQKSLGSYSLRIRTEKIHPSLAGYDFHEVDPILSISSLELVDRDEARSLAGLSTSKRVVFLVITGEGRESFMLRHVTTQLAKEHDFHLEILTPHSRLSWKLFPLARFLRAADLVICLAGNNLYYELIQAGVPAILVPSNLTNDNHQARARGDLAVSHPHSRVCSANEIYRCFPEMLSRPLSRPRAFLGAEQASELILKLFEQKT